MSITVQDVSERLQFSVIEYTYIADGPIHHLHYLESSRKSIDESFKFVDVLYTTITEDDEVRLIVDYHDVGIPPINYFMNAARRWLSSHHIQPHAKLAVVHKPDPIIGITGSLISMMRFDNLRVNFFQIGDSTFDHALAWLRAPFP
jgi:hypothetical protein